jgi:hypothetical protein
MAYYLDLFSPETYEAFRQSDRTVSGFRRRQRNIASRLQPGDRMLCYITGISRWVGVLEVVDGPFEDDTPLFYGGEDPFVIRFHVKPLVWLDKERAVPIKDDMVWDHLSFTRGHDKKSSTWTGKLRGSLNQLTKQDGTFLEQLLREQVEDGKDYPLDEKEYARLLTRRIRRHDKTVVSVTVPEDDEEVTEAVPVAEVRDSTQIQALLARIGAEMGMRIWLPRGDRANVLRVWGAAESDVLDHLPLNYDETTLKTIEQIDVLWLRRRSIVRAFEVEHSTSVYSGILRMADLLALQPNMDIKLHIVAPEERREKVFHEIRRPVFSLLEKGPLAESCTYISYETVREIAKLKHLGHLSDSVLEEYVEEAE